MGKWFGISAALNVFVRFRSEHIVKCAVSFSSDVRVFRLEFIFAWDNMGIIVNDLLELDTGLQLSNTYMTFGESPISMKKMPNSGNVFYEVSAAVSTYFSQDAMQNGARPLDVQLFKFNLDPAQVYGICYDNLKKTYSSTTDA